MEPAPPPPTPAPAHAGAAPRRRDALNSAFTVVFAAELAVNLYAHWLRDFLRDGWSLLDLAVVCLSLASLGALNGIPIRWRRPAGRRAPASASTGRALVPLPA
jgi:hypothetical protein